MGTFFAVLLSLVSVFLIMLILVQRGRGGGLTGALGGMGGQSAFGTKAGDMFTRITIVAAAVWILLCLATVKTVGSGSRLKFSGNKSTTTSGAFDIDPAKDKSPGKTDILPGDAPETTGTSDLGAKTDAGTDKADASPAEPEKK